MADRCVFLDRDGVINEYLPGEYVRSPDQLRFIPGSLAEIARLTRAGCRVAVISNQQGIGKGLFTLDDLDVVTEHVRTAVEDGGGRIDAFYYCPHLEDEGCDCRKPKPGLLLRAADEMSINLSETYMVGDFVTDILAGQAAGCKTILIVSESPSEEIVQPTWVVSSLSEAVSIILEDTSV